jgi:hypothetical protein
MEHGGSKPVPIGQIATKNINVTQQLIQGDYIGAGGTKIGTAVTTVAPAAPEALLPAPDPMDLQGDMADDIPEPPAPPELPVIPPPPDGAPESYPDPDAKGQTDDDGYPWIEHPEESGIWFYRDPESGEWVHHEPATDPSAGLPEGTLAQDPQALANFQSGIQQIAAGHDPAKLRDVMGQTLTQFSVSNLGALPIAQAGQFHQAFAAALAA